jgi:peptidoglycan/xylan/chitin deacetylase (PgdA/CDA1 family)
VLATLLGAGSYAGYEALEAPANQIFGSTLVSGPATLRDVALTFDDGPNPPYTDRILDVLERERVRATFFVVGRAAAAYPATLRRMAKDGDSIGNHTWDHSHLLLQTPGAVRSELRRTDDAVYRVTGQRTTLMRPPFGARDFTAIATAKKLGYTIVMWSVPLTDDWQQPGDATIARRVVDNVRDGSIVVLHDGNRGIVCGARDVKMCDRSQDVGATRLIVEELRARGYRFVTIPELLAARKSARER